MKQPQDNPPARLNPLALRRVDLAQVLSRSGLVSLTPNAIGHWVNQGCPRNADQRTFNLIQVCAWLAAERAKRPQQPLNAEDAAVTIRLKHERLLAIRQSRRIAAGLLIEKAEVERGQIRRIYAVKGGLLTLGRNLAQELRGVPAERIQGIVDARVNDLLLAYSEGWDGQGPIPSPAQEELEEIGADGDSNDAGA